ncbi:hypothetical protein GA0070618_3985 [Micromonospora echinospora]|uniref:Uncharacterized protein n=1 Tax=Micromonospora echinospora TaxID=1877 RepID=A0A1C4YHG0_MICEC|nr:hypothetical protein GA0070618_3985 [Micromonospora echinospora]
MPTLLQNAEQLSNDARGAYGRRATPHRDVEVAGIGDRAPGIVLLAVALRWIVPRPGGIGVRIVVHDRTDDGR